MNLVSRIYRQTRMRATGITTMVYKTETFSMRGYTVSHPTVEIAKSVMFLVKVLTVILILRWAWLTSYSDHAFFLVVVAVGILASFYYFAHKN